MKKLISVLLILSIAFVSISAATTEELKDSIVSFSGKVTDSVPRAFANSNYWADAHIGNLFPFSGFLPHFGAGASMSAVMVPTDIFSVFGDAMPSLLSSSEYFPVPALSLDARVGGLFIPFDVGVHFMSIDEWEFDFMDTGIELYDVVSYGADVRLALWEEGILLPALSIGAGYTKAEGYVHLKFASELNLIMTDKYLDYELNYSTEIYSLTAQISKKIIMITPFAGARATAQNGSYTYSAKYNGSTIVSPTTETKEFDPTDFQSYLDKAEFTVFGGVGVDFLILQTTAGVSYNFLDSTWSGSLSLHAKL